MCVCVCVYACGTVEIAFMARLHGIPNGLLTQPP